MIYKAWGEKNYFLIHILRLTTFSSFSMPYHAFVNKNLNFLANILMPTAIYFFYFFYNNE